MIKQATTIKPDSRFWNRIAERYARRPVADEQAYQTKLAKTNSYLKPAHHVLEIGCGTGSTALHHAPNVAFIRATDISEKMISIAKTKAMQASITNIEFEIEDINDLDVAPGLYDVILAHSILHLMPDVDRVFQRQHMMLKPGGLLISSTTCIGDFMNFIRYIIPVGRHLGLMPYVNVFTQEQLSQRLVDAGFIVLEHWQPKPKSATYIVAQKVTVPLRGYR